MQVINVGGRRIGAGQPCFIAAEIGINHNGDMALAHRAIEAAAAAGADAVKFQNYRTEDFLADHSLTYSYVSQGKSVTESQFAMFKRCELSAAQLGELKAHCDRLGIGFFSTPTGVDGVRDLERLGAVLIKNGSDLLTHLDLIRVMANTGLPVVLSTGMATLGEIDDAVTAFREAGGCEFILLLCTSSYPTPPEDVNLRRIPALAASFGSPVGFSDHTAGIVAALGAVALGACFVEKHFTVDRDLPGPDHRFSSDPAEFAALVQGIRQLEAGLGTATLGPMASEVLGRRDFRLSCLTACELPAGTRIAPEHVVFRRPGTGIPPKLRDALVGLVLKRAVPAGHLLDWTDFYD
jgi:N-acetylneuraminate synthase/N,N'-diacetyllegionaminate synthase